MKKNIDNNFNPFLEGNERIEEAIADYYEDPNRDSLIGVLESIRVRMNEDGHFVIPVDIGGEDAPEFVIKSLDDKDGNPWFVAFTSMEELEKGAPTESMSNFIDMILKPCLEVEVNGFVINPFGQSFMLSRELIEMIFKADENAKKDLQNDDPTGPTDEAELKLEAALAKYYDVENEINLMNVIRLLRDSFVWVPCTAVLSEEDQKQFEEMLDACDGDFDKIVGEEVVSKDNIRLVPDILKNDDGYFFPIFSSVEAMGEYGNGFSKVQKHISEIVPMARSNDRELAGIVLNAFTQPFVVPADMWQVLERDNDTTNRS